MQPLSKHWADQVANRIVQQLGEHEVYTVAAGITPSGVVHIGNFREVLTVDLVARSLRKLGKNVRMIFSWDDFDTFRKVPKNLPNQAMLKQHLRKPICMVPDPHEQWSSYAEANIKVFEHELLQVSIKPDFLYQHKIYQSGKYAESIRHALESVSSIKSILNKYRENPLDKDWLPTTIYCETCDRDEITSQKYLGEWSYGYTCDHCKEEVVTDIRTTKHLKLNWRVDWPMRWAYETVDFEPGGKDHSSEGGSYATAKEIVVALWQKRPPIYQQYDFVMMKGGTGKMSSSSGELLSLSMALDVYEPEVIRWLFAKQRPNHDFSIAFDEDVIKTYDEFDRMENQVYDLSAPRNDKWMLASRTLELSYLTNTPKKKPYRAGFRELCNRLQICDGDIERTQKKYYKAKLKDEMDNIAFIRRAQCALHWLADYAGDQFKYQLYQEPVNLDLKPEILKAVQDLKTLIEKEDLVEISVNDLNQKIYDDVIHQNESVEAKDIFQAIYMKIIGREQGPRLPSFLKEIDKERLLKLL